jgi:hypothetical protein
MSSDQMVDGFGQSGSMMGGDGVGSRVRELLNRNGSADLGQDGMNELEIPDNPGPAVAGRTPVLGSVRRSRDMPVVRDMLGDQLGN